MKRIIILLMMVLCIFSVSAWYNPTRVVGSGWGEIKDGQNVFLAVNKEFTAVYNISFRTDGELANPAMKLYALESSNPTAIDVENYYEFFKIETERIDAEKIINRVVEFRIKKVWLTGKNLKKEDIVLRKFEGMWYDVPSSTVKEDNTYVYYRAELEDFGNFVIAVQEGSIKRAEDEKKAQEEQVRIKKELEQQKLAEQQQEQEEAAAQKQQETEEEPGTTIIDKPTNFPSWLKPLIGILFVFVILIVFYKYRKNITEKLFSGREKESKGKGFVEEKKDRKKLSDIFKKKTKEPPMEFDVGLQKYTPDLEKLKEEEKEDEYMELPSLKDVFGKNS